MIIDNHEVVFEITICMHNADAMFGIVQSHPLESRFSDKQKGGCMHLSNTRILSCIQVPISGFENVYWWLWCVVTSGECYSTSFLGQGKGRLPAWHQSDCQWNAS